MYGINSCRGGEAMKRQQSLRACPEEGKGGSGQHVCHQSTLNRLSIEMRRTEQRAENITNGVGATPHYVSYKIHCTLPAHGSQPLARWHVWHRYREFYQLRLNLIGVNKALADFPFPARRWFSGMSEETIEERKQGWQAFLSEATKTCSTPEEAALLDSFLRCKEHSHPPHSPKPKPWLRDKMASGEYSISAKRSLSLDPSACKIRYGGTIAETDTLHHKTTDDIEYANTLRRNDTFGQLAQLSLDANASGHNLLQTPEPLHAS